jgi:hypothetical protein
VWSPDGSEIVVSSPQAADSQVKGPQPSVIYPDGSCLACPVPITALWPDFYVVSWDPNVGPGFLPDGRVALEVDYPAAPQLGAMNPDGAGFEPFKVSGSWQQPAWSPAGRLAAVRRVRRKSEVFVIDPLTGSTRRLTRVSASSPAWSPDGRRLAIVHRGWIELIGAGGGRLRRLTRGSAPAWAPNGKELAFVGAHGRLFVIRVRGGRPRPVGHIRARRVDWQPLTARPPSACQGPSGSGVLAASPDATVTIDPAQVVYPQIGTPAFSVLGCLTSDGHERLLESTPQGLDHGRGVVQVVIAGDYAALVNASINYHYFDSSNKVAVFDLRTGTVVAGRGGQTAECPGYGFFSCPFRSGVDQLVLGPDAVTAAHTFVTGYPNPTVEQIVANDRTGTHILDSITTIGPNPAPLLLSQLALSGDTLTWSHDGSPRSAQLN